MSGQRRGGMIQLQIGGVLQDAIGEFTYNLGIPQKEAIEGSAAIIGYSEKPQVAFIEGEIVDRGDLDLAALAAISNTTVTLTLGVGKVIMLPNAWNAADGTGETGQGKIKVRFESSAQGQEIK